MAKSSLESIRINRKVFSTTTLKAAEDDVKFWLSKSPNARLEYMAFLRRMNYGRAATGRLKRVFEIAKLEKS